mmetsp:Transcript_84073/g.223161  ORF Transcript_84073/g.223161 Transcript_84073/m.223161 type:complete len:223 (-) Transcript_84073:616-1284(-)
MLAERDGGRSRASNCRCTSMDNAALALRERSMAARASFALLVCGRRASFEVMLVSSIMVLFTDVGSKALGLSSSAERARTSASPGICPVAAGASLTGILSLPPAHSCKGRCPPHGCELSTGREHGRKALRGGDSAWSCAGSADGGLLRSAHVVPRRGLRPRHADAGLSRFKGTVQGSGRCLLGSMASVSGTSRNSWGLPFGCWAFNLDPEGPFARESSSSGA